jgi:hypothetical protein
VYLFIHPYRRHVRCPYKEIHKVCLIPEQEYNLLVGYGVTAVKKMQCRIQYDKTSNGAKSWYNVSEKVISSTASRGWICLIQSFNYDLREMWCIVGGNMGVFGLLPKFTLPLFWSWNKRLILIWIVPNFLACQCSTTNSSSFFSQCWPTFGQGIAQPTYWLSKILVGQSYPRQKPNTP